MLEMKMSERYPAYRSMPFGWYGVAYSDEVGVGGVKPVRYLDRELVVWRDDGGAAHVVDAFCPHLGAHLGHGGKVSGDRLVCPFHGWEWDAEGNNVAIPYSEKPQQRAKLGCWPVCEANGLIMLWYHPHKEPPMWEIPVLEELQGEDYREPVRHSWKLATTWQDTAENGADYVHLKYVHNTPVLPEVVDYQTDGPINKVDLAVTYYTPQGDVTGSIRTATYGPGFSYAKFEIGNFLKLMMLDWSTPLDLSRLLDNKAYFGHCESKTSIVDGFISDLVHQMEEDILIFDHKRFVEKPPLVAEDGPIAQFRKWASQFYVA